METVDTKQLDDEIKHISSVFEDLQQQLSYYNNHLDKLKERKKSIELYNKKD